MILAAASASTIPVTLGEVAAGRARVALAAVAARGVRAGRGGDSGCGGVRGVRPLTASG